MESNENMMRKTINLDKLDAHLRYIHATGYLIDDYPLSTFILAHPERAKTSELLKIYSNGTLIMNDLTAFGLLEEVRNMNKEQRADFHHLVIPDLERINARNKQVKHELISNLQIIMQEGIQKIRTKFMNVDESPIKFGVIMATTPSDLGDKRSIFRRASFMSRLIPYSYEYSVNMVNKVLGFIKSDENISVLNKEIVVFNKEKIIIDMKYKDEIMKYSAIMNKSISDFTAIIHKYTVKTGIDDKGEAIYKTIYDKEEDQLIGARALDHLIVYVKAIALCHKSPVVTDEHMEIFKEQFNYMNFSRRNFEVIEG